MLKFLFFVFFGHLLIAQNLSGTYRAEIQTSVGVLPFTINIEPDGKRANTQNGTERLAFDKFIQTKDSIFLIMEVFDSQIRLSKKTMHGTLSKKMADLKVVSRPVSFKKNVRYRFVPDSGTSQKIAKKYKVKFNDKGTEYDAVALFNQSGNKVNGTFLTTTGDYRYLQGNIIKDSLFLSCYEGNHIFLFKAAIIGDKLAGGVFGNNFDAEETWEGDADEQAKLPDAYSLTYMKPGYSSLHFSFKDAEGNIINESYTQGKVSILQILGTWCPNCMDETKFLAQYFNKNQEIKILGLAFEKTLDESIALPKIEKVRARFGVKYPILLAGPNDKADASAKFPELNKVISFPTTIILDKKGIVRKIHTGFSGPATGKYYEDFVLEFDQLIQDLLKE